MRFNRLALSTVAILALCAWSPGQNAYVRADEAATETDVKDDFAADTYTPPKDAEAFEFEAEVHRMMDIVINSLYQNKDVFLRELISNASDALDKIRFLGITDPKLMEDKSDLEVRISYDVDAKTLTVTDSGIGMTKDDLVKNLGTVARSGTTNFVEALSEGSADMSMIGQFGVGFYSAFLVADRVRVASKHPNDPVQHVWESKNGESAFLVAPDPRGDTLGRGTEITLHLKEDAVDYADPDKLKELVTHYSEFINHPIFLRTTTTTEVPKEKETEDEEDGEKEGDELDVSEEDESDEDKEEEEVEMETVTTHDWDKVNSEQSIWTRSKDEISDDDYQAFWKTVSKETYSNATRWSHFNAEGSINFNALIYLPSEIPMHLRHGNFDQEKEGLKLYVRKVLISDNFELLPRYLSFIKGVVDSDDLPLNVNRETLQESKIIKVIQKKLVRKAIEMIKKLSEEEVPKKSEEEDDEEKDEEEEESFDYEEEHPYIEWYKKFGPSLKMGVMDDSSNKNKLAKLLRYKTTKFSGEDDWVSLDEYVERMKDWQEEIYTFAGESVEDMEHSHFLDKYKEKDVEVLFFSDPVDEYMINSLPSYDGKKFQSITKEGVKFKDEDEDLVKRREKAYKKKFEPLTKMLKKIYGNAVTRVIVSKKLEKAPALITSADYTHSANMERIMKAQAFHHGQSSHEIMAAKVFEINPRHPFVTKILDSLPPESDDDEDGADKDDVKKLPKNVRDAAWMLHDMALLNSGFPIHNVKAYSNRMMRVIKSELGIEGSIELEEEIDVPVEDDEPDEPDFPGMEGMNMEDFADFDMDAMGDMMGEEL